MHVSTDMSWGLEILLRDERPIAELAVAVARALDLSEPKERRGAFALGRGFWLQASRPGSWAAYAHVLEVSFPTDDVARAEGLRLYDLLGRAGIESLVVLEMDEIVAGERVLLPEEHGRWVVLEGDPERAKEFIARNAT